MDSETDAPQNVKAIRGRLDAATPGPWHRREKAVLGPREDRDLGTGPAALLHTGMPYDGPNGRCGANAELAANAPADLAFLLRLVESLEGQLAATQKELDEQRWYGEQLQSSIDACSGNHVPIEAYER